jgi:Protein of unknown function (DUF2721)
MLSRPLNELIPVLQVAIGPVILISGISLLLLTLTNRFGRTIDRSRQLVHEMRESPANEQQLAGQVEILYRRARLIRLSIISAAAGLLLASALIIALFVTALMKWEAGLLISGFFVCSMLSLIVSLGAFMKDIQLSLSALALELGKASSPANAHSVDATGQPKYVQPSNA